MIATLPANPLYSIVQPSESSADPVYSVLTHLDTLETVRKAEVARQVAEAAEAADLASTAARIHPAWTLPNLYVPRNCTAYVASRIEVPNLGDARFWGYGLTRAGWRTGAPRRGAIGVSTRGWAGHVVLAEEVGDGQVFISEYNHIPYSYSERWVPSDVFEWYYL